MQAWYGSSSGNPVPPTCSVPCTRSSALRRPANETLSSTSGAESPQSASARASIRRWLCSSPVERTSTAPAIPASRASPPGVLTVTSTCAPRAGEAANRTAIS